MPEIVFKKKKKKNEASDVQITRAERKLTVLMAGMQSEHHPVTATD